MIRLRTLGACAIEVGPTTIGPDAERLFGVLLYLATERGRRTSRAALQELLWPEADELHARHNLRQAIYKLRQTGVEIDGTTTGVQLAADQVAFDPFDLLSGDAAATGDALLGGLMGEYLAGYSPTFSAPYAAWVEGQRAFAHARVARAAVGAMLERRARGRWAEVERLAEICLRYDPLNEEATLALAESAAMAGSKARALAILDAYIAELGDGTSIQLPATLLRRRIAERLPEPTYTVPSEACFVGRDDSLRYLHELFGHARAGRGQCCLVVGEPGIGKSRLVSEFARVGALQGAHVQQLGCQARDAERPLALFVDSVPAWLKLPGALGCSPRSLSYLKRLTEHDPTTAPSEDSREAAYLYANVRRSVLDLLDAIAQERTLLLIVEDVHWADPASWDILRDVIEWSAGRKTLLLLTSRFARLRSVPVEALPVRVHHLAPLVPEAATQLRDALTRERQRRPSEEFSAWLLRAADGNPLFLRELVIQWLETGQEGGVPPSLRALLAERLGRLGAAALRIFQACAVMGNKATFEWLQPVLAYQPHELLDGLQELEGAGLLVARAGGVRSRHELVADEALRQLPEAARSYLHRQVALVLEPQVRASAPTDASVLWECAEHWRQAGEPGRAWSVVMSCGAYLLEVGLPDRAVEAYERALQYCSSSEERQRTRELLSDVLAQSGQWSRAKAFLVDLIADESRRDSKSSRTFQAQLRVLEADYWLHADVAGLLQRCTALAAHVGLSPAMRVQVASFRLKLAGYVCSADELHHTYADIAPTLSHPDVPRISNATVTMIYHATCGDLNTACHAASELVEHQRRAGDHPALSRALRIAAYVYRRSGKPDVARSHLIESATVAENHGLAAHALLSCGILAEQSLYMRDVSCARAWYEKSVRWLSSDGSPVAAASTRRTQAKLAISEARLDDAVGALTESVAEMLEMSDACYRADCESVHIHVLLACGAELPDTLLRDFWRTFEQVKRFGDQDYPAFVAYLLQCRHDPDRARSELREYATKYRRDRSPLPVMLADALARPVANAAQTSSFPWNFGRCEGGAEL